MHHEEAYDAPRDGASSPADAPWNLVAHTGKRIAPRPSTSAFVFPGLRAHARGERRARTEACAAEAVASLVTEADLEEGRYTPG